MTQLILHLLGDYVTQSNWMALNKAKSTWAAFCHATVYSLPFLYIASWTAWLIIWSTHLLIDRFALARYVVYAKNQVLSPAAADLFFGYRSYGTLAELKAQDEAAPKFEKWSECSTTGYHSSTPDYLARWLLIACDNTMHLTINAAAIHCLP